MRHFLKISSQFHRNFLLVALFALPALVNISYGGFACLEDPCFHGICMDDLNSTRQCYCQNGYTGYSCEQNWDDCRSWGPSPCRNGGTCLDGIDSFNCSCPEPFSGRLCDLDLSTCHQIFPCENNGTCDYSPESPQENGLVCRCPPGFMGARCEEDVSVCNTTLNVCLNGGKCVDGIGNKFKCECPLGWAGDMCQTDVDECASGPCQNGGVCVDKIGDYSCACLKGYKGKSCETKLEPCVENPCLNDALCLMESGQRVCYCVPDFHGEFCGERYDECEPPDKCFNGGSCIDGVGTFTCTCPPEYYGPRCECSFANIVSSDECRLIFHNLNMSWTPPPPPTTTTVMPERVSLTLMMSFTVVTTETGMTQSVDMTSSFPAAPFSSPYDPGGLSSGIVSSTVETPFVASSETITLSSNNYYLQSSSLEPSIITTFVEETADFGKTETYEPCPTLVVDATEMSSQLETSGVLDHVTPSTGFPGDLVTTHLRSSALDTNELVSEWASSTLNFVAPATSVSFGTEIFEVPELSSTVSATTGFVAGTVVPTPTGDLLATTVIFSGGVDSSVAPSGEPASWESSQSFTTGISRIPGEETTTDFYGHWTRVPLTEQAEPTPSEGLITPSSRWDAGVLPGTITPSLVTPGFTPSSVDPSPGRTAELETRIFMSASIEPSLIASGSWGGFEPSATIPGISESSGQSDVMPGGSSDIFAFMTTPLPSSGLVTTEMLTPGMSVFPEVTNSGIFIMPTLTLEPTVVIGPESSSFQPVSEYPGESTTVTSVEVSKYPGIPTGPPSVSTSVTPEVPTSWSEETPLPGTTPMEPVPGPTTMEPLPGVTTIQPLPTGPTAEPPSKSTPTPEATTPLEPGVITQIVPTDSGIQPSTSPSNNLTDPCFNYCQNGGRCVSTSIEPMCLCRFKFRGARCEEMEEIVAVPSFSGDSFLKYVLPSPSPNVIDISTEMATVFPEGILTYAAIGQLYALLFLQNGHLTLHFSCGAQSMHFVETRTRVDDGFNFTLSFRLENVLGEGGQLRCSGQVSLNGSYSMRGEQLVDRNKLVNGDVEQPAKIVFLGGLDDPHSHRMNDDTVRLVPGFRGCVYKLLVNQDQLAMYEEARDGRDIGECTTFACVEDPCAGDSRCVASNKPPYWQCVCSPGYVGTRCDVRQCVENPCRNGATCTPIITDDNRIEGHPKNGSALTSKCLCPLGFSGDLCQSRIRVTKPSFHGTADYSGFLAYDTVPRFADWMQLKFHFITQNMSQIALLMYAGGAVDRDGVRVKRQHLEFDDSQEPGVVASDFFAISFLQGFVAVTWDLGSGIQRITTPSRIDGRLNVHTLFAGRQGRQAWLKVDGMRNTTGKSPGFLNKLNVYSDLYVGGHEVPRFEGLRHDIPMHQGFQGCIFDLGFRVKNKLFLPKAIRGRQVTNCFDDC